MSSPLRDVFPTSRRKWRTDCLTSLLFALLLSSFFIWNILLHLFCFQYFIVRSSLQIFYSTISTSDRVDLQPVESLFPPFTCRLYRRGSLECEWQRALVLSILLNFAMCRLFKGTRAARKCIFCFMIRSEQGWRSKSQAGDESFNPWTFHGSRAVRCADIFPMLWEPDSLSKKSYF